MRGKISGLAFHLAFPTSNNTPADWLFALQTPGELMPMPRLAEADTSNEVSCQPDFSRLFVISFSKHIERKSCIFTIEA